MSFSGCLKNLEVESEASRAASSTFLAKSSRDSLKDLLLQAIRYGDQPEVRARLASKSKCLRPRPPRDRSLTQRSRAGDHERRAPLRREGGDGEGRGPPPSALFRALLLHESLRGAGRLYVIRARGRPLRDHPCPGLHPRARPPHHRPQPPRTRAVLKRYERVCFTREAVRPLDKPGAPFAPCSASGPSADARRERHASGTARQPPPPRCDSCGPRRRRRGTIICSSCSPTRSSPATTRCFPSDSVRPRRADGSATFAGWAPHLDLEPLAPDRRALLKDVLAAPWIRADQEQRALGARRRHACARAFSGSRRPPHRPCGQDPCRRPRTPYQGNRLLVRPLDQAQGRSGSGQGRATEPRKCSPHRHRSRRPS